MLTELFFEVSSDYKNDTIKTGANGVKNRVIHH